MAAIGGLLSGVAAILALFIAKPDTINILIPEQALERAGWRVNDEATSDEVVASGDPAAVMAPPMPSAPVEIAPEPTIPLAPVQTRALGDGVTVGLLSLAERGDRYVATLRFENTSTQNVGVAVQSAGFAAADLVLTDGVGGSCQMIANGESWGSLDDAEVNPQFSGGSSPFRVVGAGASAQHTVFFNKGRCSTAISNNPLSLAISGTLVVELGRDRRAEPISFDSIQMTP